VDVSGNELSFTLQEGMKGKLELEEKVKEWA